MKIINRLILIAVVVLSLAGCASSQQAGSGQILESFEVISTLSLDITETSGLETLNNKLITHNDSDAAPIIYVMDTLGNIESQTRFVNMQNIDWEDIARSDSHLYIADMGNNHGNRKDLAIYKIPLESIGNTDVSPELISISYTEQVDFSYKNQDHSYDAEAIVYAQEQLYLFSKNWIDFKTTLYPLTNEPSQKLSSNMIIDINGLVTGATFNYKDRIVLCGYDSGLAPFIAIIRLDSNSEPRLEKRINLPVKSGAQIEAITYYETVADKEIYYLTSEAVNLKLGEDEAKTNGQLYRITLKAQ